MSKHYEISGRALNPPAELPDGVNVGDRVELDLDKDREQALVGAGVLRAVRTPPPSPKRDERQDEKP